MQHQFLRTFLSILAESDNTLWDLDALARKTGYSKYHLCRAFQAATQEPLQTYLRRLRLARGAEALRRGKRVLDVAIECGYQSQEAFHRAFTNMFGVTPRAFQVGNRHPSLLLKRAWKETLMPPEPLPVRDEQRDGFSLFGMGGTFSYEQLPQIEALWQRFNRRVSITAGSFGVTLESQTDHHSFRYYASVKEASSETRKVLTKIEVPRQNYKVFRYQGEASSLMAAFNYIWGVWLSEQRKIKVSGIDFEYYPPGYDPLSGESWLDIYIPVLAR